MRARQVTSVKVVFVMLYMDLPEGPPTDEELIRFAGLLMRYELKGMQVSEDGFLRMREDLRHVLPSGPAPPPMWQGVRWGDVNVEVTEDD